MNYTQRAANLYVEYVKTHRIKRKKLYFSNLRKNRSGSRNYCSLRNGYSRELEKYRSQNTQQYSKIKGNLNSNQQYINHS